MSKKILCLYSNSLNEYLNSLTDEYKGIKNIFSKSQYKDYFDSHISVTPSEAIEKIKSCDTSIEIFSFSGHANDESLFFNDISLTNETVLGLLQSCEQLKLVILNGCSTIELAKKIKNNLPGIKAVVGSSRSVFDNPAKEFGVEFFKALLEKNFNIDKAFTSASSVFDQYKQLELESKRRGPKEGEQELLIEYQSDEDCKIHISDILDSAPDLNPLNPLNFGKRKLLFVLSNVDKTNYDRLIMFIKNFRNNSIALISTVKLEINKGITSLEKYYTDTYLREIQNSDKVVFLMDEHLQNLFETHRALLNFFKGNFNSAFYWYFFENSSRKGFEDNFIDNQLKGITNDFYSVWLTNKREDGLRILSGNTEISSELNAMTKCLLLDFDIELQKKKFDAWFSKSKQLNFIILQGSMETVGENKDWPQPILVEAFMSKHVKSNSHLKIISDDIKIENIGRCLFSDFIGNDILDVIDEFSKRKKGFYLIKISEDNIEVLDFFCKEFIEFESKIANANIEKIYIIFMLNGIEYNISNYMENSDYFNILDLHYPSFDASYLENFISAYAENNGHKIYLPSKKERYSDVLIEMCEKFKLPSPILVSNYLKQY